MRGARSCGRARRDRTNAQPHSQLLRIALQPGGVQRFRFPDARSLCNDIALLPDGSVAVSDSERGAVLQLTPNGQWRTLVEPGTFGYPNGLTWLAADQRLVVADLRGLWTIDPQTARVAAVEAPEGTFVGGIDGLYAVAGDLLEFRTACGRIASYASCWATLRSVSRAWRSSRRTCRNWRK